MSLEPVEGSSVRKIEQFISIPVLFLGLLSLLFFILSYVRKYSAKTRAVMIVLAALPAGWVIGMTAIAIVLISMGLA